jgi:hypothetical protein
MRCRAARGHAAPLQASREYANNVIACEVGVKREVRMKDFAELIIEVFYRLCLKRTVPVARADTETAH